MLGEVEVGVRRPRWTSRRMFAGDADAVAAASLEVGKGHTDSWCRWCVRLVRELPCAKRVCALPRVRFPDPWEITRRGKQHLRQRRHTND